MGTSTLRFVETVTMVTETCCKCGIIFAMTTEFKDECLKQRTAKQFYCPNGHSQWYTGVSDAEKAARAERERDAAVSAMHLAEQRLIDAKQGQERELKRITKRSHAGVCQECHRTFNNVARHMKSKHAAIA